MINNERVRRVAYSIVQYAQAALAHYIVAYYVNWFKTSWTYYKFVIWDPIVEIQGNIERLLLVEIRK